MKLHVRLTLLFGSCLARALATARDRGGAQGNGPPLGQVPSVVHGRGGAAVGGVTGARAWCGGGGDDAGAHAKVGGRSRRCISENAVEQECSVLKRTFSE